MRKVLFSTDAMSGDFIIILTDAPKEALDKWCSNYLFEQEEGLNTYFDSLKIDWTVKVLADSEDGFDRDDIEVIGYDEYYNLGDYSPEKTVNVPLRTFEEIYQKVCADYDADDVELNSNFFDFEVAATKFLLLSVYAALQKELNGDVVFAFKHLVVRKEEGQFDEAYATPLNWSDDEVRKGKVLPDIDHIYYGNMKDFLKSFNGREYETGWCRICGTDAVVREDFVSGQLLNFVF